MIGPLGVGLRSSGVLPVPTMESSPLAVPGTTRIELLIPTLVQSGAEKQLALLAAGLPRPEFAVSVTCLTSGGPYETLLQDAGIPVTIIGKRWKFDPAAFFRLRTHLARQSPDILHTWLFAANSYGRLAWPARSSSRIVVSERCVDSWKSGWQLWVDRQLVARTARLIGNSRAVVDFYRPLGYREDQLRMIPNGVDTPAFPKEPRAAFLKTLGLPENARIVLCVGRLAPQKRIPDLLWAMQLLRQADPRVYLVIVGDGPQRGYLEEYARQVEVTTHVQFVGHRSDAATLWRHADVAWLGSDFEGMSNSLMEAMACGCPIVATAIPPNQELVQHGAHGYLVNVGDSAGFAQYTRRLLQDETLRQTLGEQARKYVETELSVGKMIERHVTLYREMRQPSRPV